ncbi:hypothetical protein GCM10020218_019520 [Dactylosporangium vinaceum]
MWKEAMVDARERHVRRERSEVEHGESATAVTREEDAARTTEERGDARRREHDTGGVPTFGRRKQH